MFDNLTPMAIRTSLILQHRIYPCETVGCVLWHKEDVLYSLYIVSLSPKYNINYYETGELIVRRNIYGILYVLSS